MPRTEELGLKFLPPGQEVVLGTKLKEKERPFQADAFLLGKEDSRLQFLVSMQSPSSEEKGKKKKKEAKMQKQLPAHQQSTGRGVELLPPSTCEKKYLPRERLYKDF